MLCINRRYLLRTAQAQVCRDQGAAEVTAAVRTCPGAGAAWGDHFQSALSAFRAASPAVPGAAGRGAAPQRRSRRRRLPGPGCACAASHTWVRRRRAARCRGAMGKSRARRFRRVPFSPTGSEPRREVEDGPEEEPAAELLQKVRAGAGGGPRPEGPRRPRSGVRSGGRWGEGGRRGFGAARRRPAEGPAPPACPGLSRPPPPPAPGPAPHAARQGGPALPVHRTLPCVRLLPVCVSARLPSRKLRASRHGAGSGWGRPIVHRVTDGKCSWNLLEWVALVLEVKAYFLLGK